MSDEGDDKPGGAGDGDESGPETDEGKDEEAVDSAWDAAEEPATAKPAEAGGAKAMADAEPKSDPESEEKGKAESRDAESKVADSKGATSKEADSKETDSKKADSKKADSKEADSKEADSKEADSKEAKSEDGKRASSPSQPDSSDADRKSTPRSERKAAAWGRPLARLDKTWTKWEVALCSAVLVAEVVVLTMWVGLKGLSTSAQGASNAGLVFRGLTGSITLGFLGFLIMRSRGKPYQRVGSITGIVIGIATAKLWSSSGVDWGSNLLNWFNNASTLTLFNGLRGVGTRLTLLLALIGGSLATAAGKHITIDLITRFLNARVRLPVVILGWVGSAVICAGGGWGFFDHIAIENFGADSDAKAGQKVSAVARGLGEDWFILRKQMGLDMKTLPHVIKGERYAEWMSGKEWNDWVDGAGFEARYGKEKADLLHLPEDLARSPIVLVPEKGEPRNELSKASDLVFPFGLFVMSFRFILLCLLALSGHFNIDPDASPESEIGRRRGDDDLPEEGQA